MKYQYLAYNMQFIAHWHYCIYQRKKKKKNSQFNLMRAPKLFKHNKEVLYNITEMQTKIQNFYSKK